MTDNGIFAFNITSSESFLEKDLKERNNSVYKTLKPVFNNILIINGERNIFISSKNNSCKLSAENISGNLNKRKIKNKFFTQRYINYRLNKYNQDFINTVYNNSDKTIPYNKVLKPVLYQMETVVWSSYFSASLKNMALIFNKYGFLLYPFFFILALALIISGKKVNILSGLSMSAGLNMMTLELIIIYLFQVHIGSLYSQIGAITAVFMLGSALGVLVEKKINSGSDNKKGISFSMILMSFVAVFLFSYSYANIINVLSGYIFLISLNLLTGLSGGMFFSSAVRNEDKNTSALIYSMDTLGAGIGSLITLSSLICRAGVNNSCLMIFTSLFILLVIIRMKKYR